MTEARTDSHQPDDAKAVIEHYEAIVDGICPDTLEADGVEADFVMRIRDYRLLRDRLEQLERELAEAKGASHYAAGKMVHEENDHLRERADAAERALAEAPTYGRTHALICDIKDKRYGRPLVAALHLCLDLEDALTAAMQSAEVTLARTEKGEER